MVWGTNLLSYCVCSSGALSLSLYDSICSSLSLSYATCIIAFPLHWPRGKWSSHNVTVVILIDGVDTCAVPEHRASAHTDMTNFREQIIMACIMINPLWGNGNIVNTYELIEDIELNNRTRLRGLLYLLSRYKDTRHWWQKGNSKLGLPNNAWKGSKL